jgi:histidine ammonia-lyase
MGMTSALKARQVASHLKAVLAIELLCACQALDLRKPLETSVPLQSVLARVREDVPPMWEDRIIATDIEKVAALIEAGEIERASIRTAFGG